MSLHFPPEIWEIILSMCSQNKLCEQCNQKYCENCISKNNTFHTKCPSCKDVICSHMLPNIFKCHLCHKQTHDKRGCRQNVFLKINNGISHRSGCKECISLFVKPYINDEHCTISYM